MSGLHFPDHNKSRSFVHCNTVYCLKNVALYNNNNNCRQDPPINRNTLLGEGTISTIMLLWHFIASTSFVVNVCCGWRAQSCNSIQYEKNADYFPVSAGGGAVLYTAAPLLFKEKLLYFKNSNYYV